MLYLVIPTMETPISLLSFILSDLIFSGIMVSGKIFYHVQEIAGQQLGKVLQIRNKIPRRKALISLEEEVLTILTEEGYVSKDETLGTAETIQDLFEDEDEDEEVVVDGEVDEGDVHIKPIPRKSSPLVKLNLIVNYFHVYFM